MKYKGMPTGMWLLFSGSFCRHLVTVLNYEEKAARQISAKSKSKYKQIIESLPEFEKSDRFKMNIVNCAMLVLFNGKAFNLASSIFADLKSYIDDNYVEEKTQREYGSRREKRRRMETASFPDIREDVDESASFEDAVYGNALGEPLMPSAAAPQYEGSLADLLKSSYQNES